MKTYPPMPRRIWNMRPWRRSPLMRASYRIEFATNILLAAMLVFAAPLAIGFGAMTCADIDRQATRLAASAYRADAIVDAAPSPSRTPTDDVVQAPVHWFFAGTRHADIIEVPDFARIGDHAPVLVRADGDQLPTLATRSDAMSDGIGAAVGAFAAVAMLAAALRWGLGRILDRTRHRAWAGEWATLAGVRRWHHM
jgi:hypothetical protein